MVVSQFASQKIMQPDTGASTDPAQQQTQAILKFLPVMIGFFSLNVPAGLTLYWFANNILSTAQTVYLRKTTKAPEMPAGGAAAMPMPGTPASAQPVRVEYVPKSQRKAGGAGALPPKPAPPKVEPMPDSLASEFADFDDGPAKIVEGTVVNGAATGAATAEKSSRKKGKKAKGSRKRKKA